MQALQLDVNLLVIFTDKKSDRNYTFFKKTDVHYGMQSIQTECNFIFLCTSTRHTKTVTGHTHPFPPHSSRLHLVSHGLPIKSSFLQASTLQLSQSQSKCSLTILREFDKALRFLHESPTPTPHH
jgi:hypothetical protein